MTLSSDQIKEHTLTKIRLDSVRADPTNPNKMSMPQMLALEKSMHRFGYLTPVIVDADTMMIVDGEHRYLVYKELGYEEIPAYVIKFKDEAERKTLRQVLNKLHGEHDKELDANEFLSIMQATQQSLAELADFIVQPKVQLDYLVMKYHPELEGDSTMTQEEGEEGASGERALEAEKEERGKSISLKTIASKLDYIISLLEEQDWQQRQQQQEKHNTR